MERSDGGGEILEVRTVEGKDTTENFFHSCCSCNSLWDHIVQKSLSYFQHKPGSWRKVCEGEINEENFPSYLTHSAVQSRIKELLPLPPPCCSLACEVLCESLTMTPEPTSHSSMIFQNLSLSKLISKSSCLWCFETSEQQKPQKRLSLQMAKWSRFSPFPTK